MQAFDLVNHEIFPVKTGKLGFAEGRGSRSLAGGGQNSDKSWQESNIYPEICLL